MYRQLAEINTDRPGSKIRQNLALAFSALILFGSLFHFFMLNREGDHEADPVRYGVLDLSDKEAKDIGLVNLDGAWEFYPGVFLSEPEDFPSGKSYFRVPGNIASVSTAQVDGGYGGSYRLIIKVPEDGDYGIKTKTIRNAARVILNGTESFSIGSPALTEADHTRDSRYGLAFIRSEGKEIEVIIHVSGFRTREAGIIKSISFGSSQDILARDRNNRTLDGGVIIICIVIAIHSILSWSGRRKEKFLLYAGLTSLFMGLYYSTLQEQLMTTFFDYDLILRTELQILLSLMLALAFLKFVQSYYRELKIKKLVNILSVGLLASIPVILIVRTPVSNLSMGLIQIMVVIIFAVSLLLPTIIVIARVFKRREEGYGLILAAVLFTFELIVGLKILFELEFAQIPAVLIVIFNFSLSLLMQNRLRLDKAKAEDLSRELIIKDKMKDDFLARTSGELKTPLHTITSLSSLMLEGEKGPLNIDQQEDMFFISMEGKKLSKLVDDLMDASSMDMDKMGINKQKVYPGGIINSISQEYSLTGRQGKDLRVMNEIPHDFDPIYVDMNRFLQILVIILDNAVKFTESGSIKILGARQGSMAKFSVLDTGRGINHKDLARIFDSFFRSDENEETGLGLGLTIAKQIVEIHGGKIWAESSPGQGSAFHFTLPFYDEAMDAIAETSAGPDALEPSDIMKDYENIHAEILIVSNDLSHVKVLTELLESEDYKLLLEHSGENVLKTIKENQIHLAIIDMMLPDTSGDKLCRDIRENYTMAELPIIIFTASGKGRDLSRSFECGANDFIKKPVEMKDLKTRVKSQLLMKASYEAGLEREFNYFYSQLSPHFIYNSLNSIVGLSFSDIEGTRKALENLGTYLRMKMDSKRAGKLVDLSEEVELMEAYLDIEKIRYGDRLEVEITGVEDFHCLIPPLTLQPLVENSVRYGINHGEVLKIKVDVKEERGLVYIKVSDNGPGIKDEEKQRLLKGDGKGRGLTNLIRRIKIQRKSFIEIEDAPAGGTIITITMPKE